MCDRQLQTPTDMTFAVYKDHTHVIDGNTVENFRYLYFITRTNATIKYYDRHLKDILTSKFSVQYRMCQ